jgi:arylsulfatase A-like enzyme
MSPAPPAARREGLPIGRLTQFLLAALLSGCSPSEPLLPPEPSESPPNIVVILVDDLGFGDVGFLGSEIRTPRIDELARSGLVLERYYASAACTASRAQLLTGKFAARVGLENNVNFEDLHGLAEGVTTLADLLGSAGYRTHLVGKWHLGHLAPEHHPLRHGFDHFYGHLSGWIDYQTHERNGGIDWYRDEERLEEEGYSTTLLTREGVRLIRESSQEARPLFLYLAYNAPHFPLHVAPGKEMSAAGSEERRQYRTMVEALDDGVGEITAALRETGLAKNTIILFASDNGGIESFGASNAHLRGHKFTMYEGGLRVPAILTWPERIPAGRSAQVVTNLDVLPTLCAAVGLEDSDLPLQLDGANLLSPLVEGRQVPRQEIYFSLYHQRNWKSALLRGPVKLVHTRDREGRVTVELFNVAKDESERNDISSVRVETVESLLRSLQACAQDCGFGPGVKELTPRSHEE